MKRKKVMKKVDARVFKNTATRGKKINVSPRVDRGGIRL